MRESLLSPLPEARLPTVGLTSAPISGHRRKKRLTACSSRAVAAILNWLLNTSSSSDRSVWSAWDGGDGSSADGCVGEVRARGESCQLTCVFACNLTEFGRHRLRTTTAGWNEDALY